jgi:hypothetical protein
MSESVPPVSESAGHASFRSFDPSHPLYPLQLDACVEWNADTGQRDSTLSGLVLSRMVLLRELIGCCLSVSPPCWTSPGWLRPSGVKGLQP